MGKALQQKKRLAGENCDLVLNSLICSNLERRRRRKEGEASFRKCKWSKFLEDGRCVIVLKDKTEEGKDRGWRDRSQLTEERGAAWRVRSEGVIWRVKMQSYQQPVRKC